MSKQKKYFDKTFSLCSLKQKITFGVFLLTFLFISPQFAQAQEHIEVRGQVGTIVAGPSTEDTSDSEDDDGGSNKKPDFISTSAPDFSVWPSNFNGAVFTIENNRPRFTTIRPAFEGKTNIQNARITLVFWYGAFSLRSTAEANASGDWRWASPVDFPLGSFEIKLQAVHPKESSLRTETALGFDVAGSASDNPWNEQFPEDGTNIPFDLLVSIKEEYRKIAPGENIIAHIRLLNYDVIQNTQNVPVEYSIQDEAGREIFYQKETLAINKELSYVKAFYTQPEIPEGTYRLIVKIASNNTLATGSAEFVVKGKGQLLITPFAKIDYSLILMGVGVIFFIFLLLSYFELIRFLQVRKHIHYVTEKFLKRFF